MKYAKILLIALPAITLLTQTSTAQERGPARSMMAVRTNTPPVIDGKLDDECWSQANVETDFTDYRIEQLAKEQTFVRVLYDDENIYIAFECIEPDPNSIVGVERKYDQSLREEDYVTARLDTFHDHRCCYVFSVNTLGTRFDARMGLFDYFEDDTWGCEWTAASTVAEDRWFAEMSIPISNMLFRKKDAVSWGANFYRSEKSLSERSYWCYRNSRARYPNEFGNLTNLDLAKVKIKQKPSYETYFSTTSNLKESSNKLSTGLDMTLRLNSEITSAFTINPDFGQVEADPDTIELRDTERFLREKRPFFREGNELFGSPLNIYYSRRFMDIEGGGKMTGQGQNWALGLLDVQGERERNDHLFTGNYHVGRYIHKIGENSHIGGIWANSNRSNGTNITGGVDARLYFDSTNYLTAQFLQLRDSEGIDTDGIIDHDAYGLYTALSLGSRPLWWRVDYRDITRGFRPDLGYIPRRDIRGPGSFLRYREYYDEGIFKSFGAFSEIEFYENNDHETTLRDFDEGIGATFRNEFELWYMRRDSYHAPYQNYYDRIRIEYNEEVDIWDSISVSFAKGVYEEEPYKEYSLEKPMKFTERLVSTFEGNYRVKEENGNEDIWLWRSVTQYTFPWNGRIKFTAEETSEDRHNLTLLFSWPMKDDTDIYFVLNDYEDNGDEERGAFFKIVYRF